MARCTPDYLPDSVNHRYDLFRRRWIDVSCPLPANCDYSSLPITNWLWLTLISFFVYGGILALHLFCWRTIISKFLNHVLAPDQIKIGNEALIGSRGALRNIDGHWMIHIGEEWIPCNINLPVSNSVSIIYGIVTDIAEDKNLVVSLEIDNKEAKNVLQ